MRQRRCTGDPSARSARQHEAVYSSARRSSEKESCSAINVGWNTSRGRTGESNGLSGLKTFPDEGEPRATSGKKEHRVVQECSGRILISDWWRSGIGALLDSYPGHTARCPIVRAVNGG